MSTKTLRKRIALVAVAALGAGLLSVAPASASSHLATLDALSTTEGSLAPAFNTAILEYDAGTVSNSTNDTTVAFSLVDDDATATCQGVSVAVGNGNGNATCGAVALAVGLNTITIVVTSEDTMTTLTTTLTITRAGTDAGIDASPVCTASNSGHAGWYLPVGAVVTVDVDSLAYVQITSSIFTPIVLGDTLASINSKGYVTYDAQTDTQMSFTVSAGTGKIIVDTANDATAVSGNSDSFTVGVCAGTTYDAAGSNIQVTEGSPDTSPDKTIEDDLTAVAGNDLYINMDILNGYEVAVAEGLWYATATNGATVLIDDHTIDTSSTGAGALPFDDVTRDGSTVHVRVTPKDAAVSQTTTVAVYYKGTLITTKNLKFLGEATKISIVANTIGESGSTNFSGMAWFTLQDAAGNNVPGDVSADSTTFGTVITNVQPEVSTDPAGQASGATDIGDAGFNTAVLDDLGGIKYGIVKFQCAATGTSGTVTLVHTNIISGDDIKLPVTFTCAGGVDTYAVSLNAASYKVGEVGTLTVTAKDAKGNPVNDFSFVGGDGNIALGGGADWVKAPGASDFYGILGSSAAGTKTYKVQFTAGGAWNVVSLMSGATTKSATTAYTVTSGGTSLEDVLKAIVSLIASINKQIAALQKALLKKK